MYATPCLHRRWLLAVKINGKISATVFNKVKIPNKIAVKVKK